MSSRPTRRQRTFWQDPTPEMPQPGIEHRVRRECMLWIYLSGGRVKRALVEARRRVLIAHQQHICADPVDPVVHAPDQDEQPVPIAASGQQKHLGDQQEQPQQRSPSGIAGKICTIFPAAAPRGAGKMVQMPMTGSCEMASSHDFTTTGPRESRCGLAISRSAG